MSKNHDCLATTARCSSEAVVQCSGAALVAQFCALSSDVVANIFCFGHLSDVLNVAGTTCRTLHHGVWAQPQFWIALGGPAFVEHLGCGTVSSLGARIVTGAFRRWFYHIEDNWCGSLEQIAECNLPVEVFHEAHDYVRGLTLEDVTCADMWRLVHVITRSMQASSASDEDASDAASAFVARCCARTDLFGHEQLTALSAELGELQERSLQEKLSTEHPEDVLDPWALADDSYSLETQPPVCGHTGRCLSASFLAVMDETSAGQAW